MHKVLLRYLHHQLMGVSYNTINSVVLDLIFKTTQLLRIFGKHNQYGLHLRLASGDLHNE